MSRFSDIYFTGSQCQVIIGDSVISEAVAIEGVLQVDQTPFYGYASRHFDAIGKGRVIAMGSLTINYVFDGYLLAHINQDHKVKLSKEEESTAVSGNPSVVKPGEDGYYKEMSDIELLEQEIFIPDDEAIKMYQDEYWSQGNSGYVSDNGNRVRPEFNGPFDIKIRDFRVGDIKEGGQYEEKKLVDVFINKYSTIRRTDAGATTETYQFICRTFI